MTKRGFSFKRFHIDHDLCAMKVGTDGILLGAWAKLDNAKSVLDIGTGSGLIALQLAQRSESDCLITALEIDPQAVEQAQVNVLASPWPDKVAVVEQSVQAFAGAACHHQQYDLIVSNPPYFPAGQTFTCQARAAARHTGSLNKKELMSAVSLLLAPTGRCALVLPYDVALEYIEAAQLQGLYLAEQVDVYTKANKPPHRMLLSLVKQACRTEHSHLHIHQASGEYSTDYVSLTREFYLKMR